MSENKSLKNSGISLFAKYWSEGKVQVVLHGLTHHDDRATELTTAQALRLAEMLVRSARQGVLEKGDIT
jgi:hypothetical protein